MSTEKKILLVDDQPNFLKMLSIKLSKMGYAVVTASNGKEGVEMAAAEVPDLIVLDIMMPVLDGFSAAEQIRAGEATRAIPIIFLSAKGQPEDKKRAADLGAADFFSKPFSPKSVVDRIEELVPP